LIHTGTTIGYGEGKRKRKKERKKEIRNTRQCKIIGNAIIKKILSMKNMYAVIYKY
jgi:hypothetical protein